MELNLYFWIILVTILADFGLNLVSDVLNVKAMKPEVPEGFTEVYPEDDYRKSQLYTGETTRFGLISSVFGLAVTLAFWFLGGFPLLDGWIRSLGFGELETGLIFIFALLVMKLAAGLPFSLYSTFVIEEKFGFNRTTWKTWCADLAKSLVLGAVIGLPVLALVLWFFMTAGPLAWLWVWISVTVIMLFIQFIAPTWIMPLFNKFTPLENDELKAAIRNYAGSVQFSLKDIFIMDGSRRSAKANAFFTGFGKNKRIALFDTMVGKHTTEEIVAVVAHEVGHYKRRHILKGMVTGILQTGLTLFLLGIFLSHSGLFLAFGLSETPVYAGLIFFGMLLAPVDFFLDLIQNRISRKHEFEADAWAVQTTGNSRALADALKKLSRQNLSNLTPHPLHVFLHYSHPPLKDRIAAMERISTPLHPIPS